MTTEKTYTPAELERLTGFKASDFTSKWVKGELPHAFIDRSGSHPVLRIPESDVSGYLRASRVKPLPTSDTRLKSGKNDVKSALEEKTEPAVLPEESKSPENSEIIDPPISMSETRKQADAIIENANTRASEIIQKAEETTKLLIETAKQEATKIVNKANETASLKIADAEKEYNERVNRIIDTKTADLQELQSHFDELVNEYNQLREAAEQNLKYHEHQTMITKYNGFLGKFKR